MNPFQSIRNYEEFIYTLKQQFSSIQSSTLIVIRRGSRTAMVQGETVFLNGYRIAIKERLLLVLKNNATRFLAAMDKTFLKFDHTAVNRHLPWYLKNDFKIYDAFIIYLNHIL